MNPLCEDCEQRPAVPDEVLCQDCLDTRAEMAWERRLDDGETFRGGEAESFESEKQAWIQRNLK